MKMNKFLKNYKTEIFFIVKTKKRVEIEIELLIGN